MAGYDNPVHITYTLAAAAVDASATLLSVQGPFGLQGKLVAVGAVVTTAVTVAATEIEIGDGTDKDKFGSLTIAIASSGVGFNNATLSTNTLTQDAGTLIAANEKVVISTTGAATAGDADVTVTIAWF